MRPRPGSRYFFPMSCSFRMRVRRCTLHRPFKNAGSVKLVFRPIEHHRIGADGRAARLIDLEIANERGVLVIGKMEHGVVELAVTTALHELPQPMLGM